MSRERTLRALLFALSGAVGCTAYPTMKNLPIDCTVDSAYDLDPVDESTAFGYGDTTTGATMTTALTMLPDGARCNTTTALLITTHHYNDWGAAAGFYGFIPAGSTYRDESAYEGMSFWARAPGATGKSFTIVLDDFNTYDATPLPPGEADAAADPNPTDSNCISYSQPDAGGVTVTIIDPSTGVVLSSGQTTVTAPNACGNGHTAVVTVTSDWRFYTVPFNQFQQTAMPNRAPNSVLTETGPVKGTSLLTNKLTLLTLRVPKEAEMALWFDKLGFYRKKGSVVGGDGGTDAPRM